jgi:hypothetical protein
MGLSLHCLLILEFKLMVVIVAAVIAEATLIYWQGAAACSSIA